MNQHQKDLVTQLYNDGWNPEDIANELGYDETEVIEYCSEILYSYDRQIRIKEQP